MGLVINSLRGGSEVSEEGRGARDGVHSPMASDLISHACNVMKPPQNAKGLGSEIFQVGEDVEIEGGWHTWRGHGSSASFLHALPWYLFHLAAPQLQPLVINW